VNGVMNLQFPQNAGNFMTSCKLFSLSRRTLPHGVSKYTMEIMSTECDMLLTGFRVS